MLLKLTVRRLAVPGVLAAVLATGAMMLAAASAEAGWRGRGYHGGWYAGYYPGYYGYRSYHPGAAVAAGVAGLAAGAIIASALSRPTYYAPPPVYYAPPPVVVYAPAPVHAAPPYDPSLPAPSGIAYTSVGLVPGSPDWNAYCASKYRSFDPATGTFMGYEGRRHYCR